ncbi:DUF3445 domain-containing protein [Pseudoclavibacter sp. RFBA6]|nr:DUF3445 domain-containing protein [Pseudoclavibacter sp. RFBA6]
MRLPPKRRDPGARTVTAPATGKADHSVAVAGFPFPFPKETYRYSTNVEPASVPRPTAAGSWGEHPVDIDHAYRDELAERARILSADPSRLQCLPHMVPAAWDAMFVLMEQLADAYPQHMSLTREGGGWHWHNGLLGIDRCFAVGETSSMPEGPLGFIGQQMQEDIVLLEQRDGELWADAGLVTFAADWSFGFDVGMSFLEIHGPVPRVHDEGVIPRAQAFLMRLEPGQSYRRTNWTLTVDGKLDTSTETYPEWGPDRTTLVDGPLAAVGDRLHLRTEVQHLIRLPESNAIMFLIRSYLLPFAALATVPEWAARTAEVLEELPVDMAEYKGVTRTREAGIRWLREYGGVCEGSAAGAA